MELKEAEGRHWVTFLVVVDILTTGWLILIEAFLHDSVFTGAYGKFVMKHACTKSNRFRVSTFLTIRSIQLTCSHRSLSRMMPGVSKIYSSKETSQRHAVMITFFRCPICKLHFVQFPRSFQPCLTFTPVSSCTPPLGTNSHVLDSPSATSQSRLTWL